MKHIIHPLNSIQAHIHKSTANHRSVSNSSLLILNPKKTQTSPHPPHPQLSIFFMTSLSHSRFLGTPRYCNRSNATTMTIPPRQSLCSRRRARCCRPRWATLTSQWSAETGESVLYTRGVVSVCVFSFFLIVYTYFSVCCVCCCRCNEADYGAHGFVCVVLSGERALNTAPSIPRIARYRRLPQHNGIITRIRHTLAHKRKVNILAHNSTHTQTAYKFANTCRLL